ncbi:MAG: hydantoinase/oxoprolinase family protein, partial [Candidatus Binatia bacterium]
MTYAVAVDIGGTFTDLVGYDYETGKVIYAKSPTTYENLVEGILDCLEKAKLRPDEATLVNHGTTLVINSLIQRRGAKTALVTSAGFRDILEIARGNRPDPFDLHYKRDEPLIPRELRLEVCERMDSKGGVIDPLDVPALEKLAAELKELGVEAVAIFFMNSYVNPTHEEACAEILRRLVPDVYVTFSTDLTREWYEYERCSTVAANAYVGPQVSTYIQRLESELKTQGFGGSLFMMGSNGGLLSAKRAGQQPINLVESGPIGGCIGAGAYAEALGFKNVVAFDMGGTTAKCALVENGRFTVNSIYYVNGYVRGFPIKSPVVDIVEVGSGGGSVAWLDSQTRLHVGPQSAGSTPGPVCYGRGGTEPTVTDANLVLGRLNADRFLGGELKLDANAARRSIEQRVAEPLGYVGSEGMIQMAEGIISIAIVIMAGAIRRISVEHGLDPRDFVLFSYGGGGPLHACAL